MLLKFTVGNYKVFKEKSSLDLRAANVSEFLDTNVIDIERGKLLKSVAIYGKNASGKSNLLKALAYMSSFVISSAKDTQSNEKIKTDRFRLSTETQNGESYFETIFILNKITYRYGFEVNTERVTKEWLFERPKNKEYSLFLRIENEFQIDSRRFPEGKNKEEWTRPNALFLSLCAQLNGELSHKMIDWFSNLVFVKGDFMAGYYLDMNQFSEKFITENENNRLELLKLLKKADIGIDNITKKADEHEAHTYHKIYDENNQYAGDAKFSLIEDESTGTAKFFAILGYIIDAVKNGKVIFIDEIGTMMHTLLSKAIVMHFNSEKNTNAQLIFTTHDTNLLDNELLRRDQIYFVEKNKYGAGRIYSLADFKTDDNQKVRKDADYESNYLRGRYGAIPFIKEF